MKAIHWPTAAQFGLSILAIVNLWGAAFGVLLLGLVEFSRREAGGNILQLMLFAAAVTALGIGLLPSAGYSFLRLIGKPTTRRLPYPDWMRPTLLILALPLVMAGGYLVANYTPLAWLLLPPLHILAVGLPVLWLVHLASRDLPAGSPQRVWGLFASGATLAPVLAFIAEVLLFISGAMVWGVWASTQPELLRELTSLAARIQEAGPTPELLQHIFQPYLTRPMVWVAAIGYIGLLVPLLEELLKPVAVWLLIGRGLTPVEGWTAGVLSGAGFAFAESLMLSSSGQDWAFLVFARIGTGMIHSLTAGLVGWGLASAWSQGRYLRLGATYLAAVSIHALWNTMTIASTASEVVGLGVQFIPDWALEASRVLPFVLGLMALLAFTSLLLINAYFLRDLRKVKNGVDNVPD